MKELQDTVTTASLNYEIWWVFRGNETRPKYVEVMNKYLHYFHAAIGAHFVALLVALYRLYETRSDTYNIPTFLDRIEKNRVLKKEDIDQLRNQYELTKPLWIKVSILRNKVYGHRELDLDIDEAFEEAGIKPNEIRDLVSQTKALLNDLDRKLRDNTHAFNLSAENDTLRLLNDLKSK